LDRKTGLLIASGEVGGGGRTIWRERAQTRILEEQIKGSFYLFHPKRGKAKTSMKEERREKVESEKSNG